MKYLIAIGLFAAGITIGYFWGNAGFDSQEETDESPQELLTETIRDTIFHTETIQIPFSPDTRDSLDLLNDSTEVPIDSLITEILFDDTTTTDDNVSINREKLMRSIKIPIKYLVLEEEKDTIIKDLLGIEETKPSHIYVEFWTSPLNFEGYKLSRNKLVLYGLSTQFDYQFYRKSDEFYLTFQNIYYLMKETQDFLPYLQVEKKELFSD